MVEIFKKQYILSAEQLDVPISERRIGDLFLYTDEELKITELELLDGRKLWLLGNAFCTHREICAEDDAKNFDGDDLISLTRNWTGRWTLITENEIFNDATGLMSVFYHPEKRIASSSLALMSCVTGQECGEKVKSSGISWQILPSTRVDGVYTLLATEKLYINNERFEAAFCNWITDYRHLTAEEKCRKTADMLSTALKNIHNFSGKKILLALTGGKDSRVTFAALVKSGVPFSAYTAEHSEISSSDKVIPRKLANRFGIEHTYVKGNKINADKLQDYYRFSAGNSNGADAVFYAAGQFDGFGKDTVIIRSGIYEAAQSYARSYTKADQQGFADGMTSYYSDLRNNESQKKAFAYWLEAVNKNPINYIDIRDRFYIEQRVGGWAAAIEQSLDINEFTSIQIVNSAELLSVFLSCNDREREELSIAYGTINMLDSRALELDINKRTLSDKIMIIIRALKKRLKRR